MSTEAEVRIVTSGKRSGVGADRNSDGPVFVERTFASCDPLSAVGALTGSPAAVLRAISLLEVFDAKDSELSLLH
jgi:hypothetical protein